MNRYEYTYNLLAWDEIIDLKDITEKVLVHTINSIPEMHVSKNTITKWKRGDIPIWKQVVICNFSHIPLRSFVMIKERRLKGTHRATMLPETRKAPIEVIDNWKDITIHLENMLVRDKNNTSNFLKNKSMDTLVISNYYYEKFRKNEYRELKNYTMNNILKLMNERMIYPGDVFWDLNRQFDFIESYHPKYHDYVSYYKTFPEDTYQSAFASEPKASDKTDIIRDITEEENEIISENLSQDGSLKPEGVKKLHDYLATLKHSI